MLFFIVFVSILLILTFFSAPFFVWLVFSAVSLIYLQAHWLYFLLLLGVIVFISIPSIRQMALTRPLMWFLRKTGMFPRISPTEKSALEAGQTWVEKEFFSGRPDLKKLYSQERAVLTQEERDFLQNETQTLCSMIDDWHIYKTRQIPKEIDDYVRSKKFLGLIIPKKYGGLGFSHLAHSQVLEKICSRSYAVGIYVMVPNSLGPAELIIHYGTEKQKEHFLPRLADGREIPCFGLTEPQAGSDASSIESTGVLFKDENGELKIRMNWNKRWITLASVSTLLGVAFRLQDPEQLLGGDREPGITCALVPADTPGVQLGRRHDPMGIPFPNCPMEGREVVISAEDYIIGGVEQAGKGWAMLMECLGTGRGISLPSSSLASMKLTAQVVYHHAVVRRQFGLSIGKFEGVEEALAVLSGFTFLSQAMLNYTLSALSRKIPSSLCSAMTKYQTTEMARQAVSCGMDIMGGAGLSMGPKNLIALSYIASPISITVEGANILTRSFIIFGQGLIRAHPFAYKEIQALEQNNLPEFDESFWNHTALVVVHLIRVLALSLTRGLFVRVPGWKDFRGIRAWQKISWASAVFALLQEMAMAGFGGRLKIKEKLTGRFADALMGLYMASAVLWYWDKEGRDKKLKPFVWWGVEHSLQMTQKSFEGILYNFQVPFVSWFFKKILFHLVRLNPLSFGPGDKLSSKISQPLMKDSQLLDQITKGIHIPQDESSPMAQLKKCYEMSISAGPIENKIKKAVREQILEKNRIAQAKDQALEKGVITKEEHTQLAELEALRWQVIQVDSFTQEEYLSRG